MEDASAARTRDDDHLRAAASALGRDGDPSSQVLEALARVLQVDDVERRYLFGVTASNRGPGGAASRSTCPRREPARGRVLSAAPTGAEPARLAAPRPRGAGQQGRTTAAAAFIGAFGENLGDDADDPRMVELVGELALASERFRALWARHDVRGSEGGAVTVHHPVVGRLELNRDKRPVGGLTLVFY